MRIVEELDQLLDTGKIDSTFPIHLSRVLREMRQDWGRSPEAIRDELTEVDREHPFLTAVVGLSRWVENETYHEGAELAIAKLDEGFQIAQEEGWPSLAATLLEERIKLLVQLQHTDALESTITDVVSFLQREDELASGPTFNLLHLIVERPGAIPDDDLTEDLLTFLEEQAEQTSENQDYNGSRRFWRCHLQICQAKSESSTTAKNKIISSYQKQLEKLQGRHHAKRASVAHEAIQECVEWVDETTRAKWEQEHLAANRASINEMGEFSHQLPDDKVAELDSAVESIIEQFEEIKRKQHAVSAIKWLVNQDQLFPNSGSIDRQKGYSFREMIDSRTITSSGGSYSQDESGGGWSDTYSVAVQHSHNVLQDLFYRLQNRELIHEGDLFILFNRHEVLGTDTTAFLTDFIISFFENRGPAATHIGMAQLEAVIRSQMEKYEKSTLRLDPTTDELHPRSMTGLLGQLEGDISDSWLTYMRYRYTDLSGQNVRNKIAHGHLKYRQAQWGMGCILLFDMLRSLVELDRTYS